MLTCIAGRRPPGGLLFACLALAQFVRRSKLGRILIAMRDREDRVRFSGYDVASFQIFIFCVGAAFAQLQIKAIFSILLREFEFELAQPPESYHNDHTKMVVQLAQPAKVRYRKRVQG